MADALRVRVEAAFPHKQGAISKHGGDGMRIVLDIPEAYKTEVIKLFYMTNTVLTVTIEEKLSDG